MKKKIVLSGDIIASTSLSIEEKNSLEKKLNELISILVENFPIYGRIIKGDYLEVVVENPEDALLITLLIKSFIKSAIDDQDNSSNRYKKFKNYGIRIAMGFGELSRYDKQKGIIDGNAIYYSGRKINEETSTYNKQRIVIKNTLFFISDNDKLDQMMDTLLSLLDILIGNATAKQSQVLFLRLLGNSEKEISTQLNIKQPTVNKQLTSVGWNAIDKSVTYFKTIIKDYE